MSSPEYYAQPGTYQELGFEERLSLLTVEELTCRENRKAERLIKHARFRLNAELSKLDYRNNRGLDRALIRSLSQGNWLTLKQNILLTGATGSGKTFLACALGHNACRQGYKVYYYRLKALMEQCYQGHADGRYSKLLTRLNNSDLLLLDDWGLEPLSSEQRSDLLEIVDLMYQRGSIIVVSQLPVENWYKMIGCVFRSIRSRICQIMIDSNANSPISFTVIRSIKAFHVIVKCTTWQIRDNQ
ncbi:TPA: IS21-like element helper ATPase IstB [Escherichia coli]